MPLEWNHLIEQFPPLVADWFDYAPPPSLVGAVLGLLVLGVVAYFYLRPQPGPPPSAEQVDISVDALTSSGPSSLLGPKLTLYNVPIRVVAIVVAPVGRTRQIPDEAELRRLMSQFLPGMMEVIRAHRPDFYRWPGQVSTSGFAQSFFVQANLPGNHGQGTPWAALAGRFESDGRPYLVGLVCCADEDNPIGQVIVERSPQWLDILRIQK
ncbi:MAG: hypothetical protein WDZ51_09605 [Pirellulaceae bacterium]